MTPSSLVPSIAWLRQYRRARLNIISHLLGKIPYKTAPREKVKLPKRQKPGSYRDPTYPFKYIKERF